MQDYALRRNYSWYAFQTDYKLEWTDCSYDPPEITIEINTTSDIKADGLFLNSWKP